MYYIPYNYPYYRYVPVVPYVYHYEQAQMNYQHNFEHIPRDNRVTDQGPNPFVIDIEQATENNHTFRTALWTGDYMQLTLMSIPIGEEIGLEMHRNVDQFIRVEDGDGFIEMGPSKNNLPFRRPISEDYIAIIPAGTWHNVKSTGDRPLKLYSIYTPPEHPYGTVHPTKADAMAAENHSS